MEGENKKLEESNKKLEGEIDRLKGEVEKMIEENKKFAENNTKLEEQVIIVFSQTSSIHWYMRLLLVFNETHKFILYPKSKYMFIIV